MMFDKHGIIMTVGIYSVATGENRKTELQTAVMQAVTSHKEVLQAHAFYYSEKEGMLSIDIVPEDHVDEIALVNSLAGEIQPLVPGMQVVVVVDHNYSE